MNAQRKFRRNDAASQIISGAYDSDNSCRRVQRWLSKTPNTSRSTWVKVAGCLRNIEAEGYQWAYPLFEEWSAHEYADFDPEECEKLWESLTPGVGGFGALKKVAQYFERNPGEDEIDSTKLNNQRFNNAISTYKIQNDDYNYSRF